MHYVSLWQSSILKLHLTVVHLKLTEEYGFHEIFIYSNIKFASSLFLVAKKLSKRRKRDFVTGRIHSVGFTRKSVGRWTDWDLLCRCHSSKVFWSSYNSLVKLARSISLSLCSVFCKTSREHQISYFISQVKCVPTIDWWDLLTV